MSDVTSDSFQSDRAFFGAVERYNTPISTPTTYLCRRVRIPDSLDFIAAVNELLSRLCFPEMWLERSGGLTPDEAAVLANVMYDDYAASEGYCMIGAIVPVMLATLPDNMLWCDGSTYLRVDYPDLYAVLDSAFKPDADHFIVPDMGARVVIGSNSDYAVNATGGAATHTLTSGEMPSHTHVQDSHNHTQNAHTHVQDSHNHTQNSHNHTQNAHGHTGNSHSHSITDAGHNHSMAHDHTLTLRTSASAGSTAKAMASNAGVADITETTSGSSAANTGSHTTGISIDNSVVSVQDATATNQATTATNQAATATNQATTATNQNATATNQNTGGGGAHNNLQPYRALKYAVIAK